MGMGIGRPLYHQGSLLLERFAYTPFGTFGELSLPEFRSFTIERPWLNNIPSDSCIPIGIYQLRLGAFLRGGYPAYELISVPERSLIKIHIGNTMDDLRGCIAPGKSLGAINGRWAVLGSREAFEEFMRAMEALPLYRTIEIRNRQGGMLP